MWEPPGGLINFVQIVQRIPEAEAIDLLRSAFDNAAIDAVYTDIRLRNAAPALLDACRLAVQVFELHEIDCTDLRAALGKVEKATPALLQVVPGEVPRA